MKPIGEKLGHSFVAPGMPESLIPAGIFGFPKVLKALPSNCTKDDFSQGSRFLQFVIAAARKRFLTEEFVRFPVFIQFGPVFLSTAFVSFN